jgi:HEAT repeat protein/energy-coupling factor transporter ATP-binding protein EcfA2
MALLETLGIKALESLAGTVAGTVTKGAIQGVSSRLEVSELQKAIKAGIVAANEKVDLFSPAEQGVIPGFLNRVFELGVQELQKPLKNEGIPDVAYLVKVFEEALKDELNKDRSKLEGRVDESRIRDWIEAFVNTYFEQTSGYLRFQVAKENYFKQLENYFDDVKFAGIAVEGQEIDFKSEKLDQIFVMLDVVEDVWTRPDRWQLTIRESYQEFFLERTNSRQAQLIREQQQRAQLDYRSGKKIPAQQLLSQNQLEKVVLLGAPGSGKTTLMSYFAVILAHKQPEKLGLAADTDWLPILIRIRDLARQPNLNILDYARQFANNTLCVNPPLPPGFFESWLEDGRALILLDGLDEVPEEGKRDEVVRYIENFLGQFERNRAIITSRPAGYRRDFFRTDEFPHYEVQPFDDAKIEEFINRWYDSRVKEDKPEAERCKDSLRKALSDNARIKLLARNPLLLTIIALIHRYQAVLPKQRYKLYSKAVETLLTSWDANKELSNHTVLQYLGLDDLQGLMESLAYWIHTQGSTGDNEGGTLIDRDELIEQLSKLIRTKKQVDLRQARNEAKRFVDFIRERTGLLNEQGKDCYAFVHKTFQEYLCAQEINYQADNEGDFDIILNHIRDHLHDSHWREVLLLLIAQQRPKKAAKAIRAILDYHSDYEQWLHRDLLFAGSCLAENPKDLKVADNRLPQEILEKLVELEVSDSQRVGWRIREQAFQILCSLNETEFEAPALELLKNTAAHIGKVRLQKYRAALGEKEEAIACILTLLKDENSSMRSSAAFALGNLGNDSEVVLTALLESFKDENSSVRFSAADALGNLGNDSEVVLTALLESLKDEDSDVCSSAADALGNLGNDSEVVLTALLESLKDEDSSVRFSAGDALANLGNDSEAVLTALLESLKDENTDVRFSAADVLGKLGNDSEAVLTALLESLKDEDSSVRFRAANALGKLGNDSEAVLTALLESLKDEDSSVRFRAANALGKLGNNSEAVLTALLESLKDEDSSVRSIAANALANLGNDFEAVLTALIEMLKDEDSVVRSSAAFALGKLGNNSKAVLTALLESLKDEDSSVRFRAAFALGKLGNNSEAVLTALLESLKDEDSDVRFSAGDALGNLGNDSEAVLTALLESLKDEDYSVHSSAANALGKLDKKSRNATTAVAHWIEQNRDSEYVEYGINVLWNLVTGE